MGPRCWRSVTILACNRACVAAHSCGTTQLENMDMQVILDQSNETSAFHRTDSAEDEGQVKAGRLCFACMMQGFLTSNAIAQ